MSAKKYQQVNSLDDKKNEYKNIVLEINNLVKKIKLGSANKLEIDLCKNLTEILQNLTKNFNGEIELDRWIARETIEMSKYTCNKYGHLAMDDKI